MRGRSGRVGRAAAIGLLVTGCFLPATVLRAANADPGHAADKTAADAAAAGTGNYFDGLRVGAAQGRLEGRALQIGDTVPPGSRHAVEDAFKAGYTAGSNDAFTGFDGGWALAAPYIVTLAAGGAGIAYRIDSRVPLQPDVNYYLCADGHSLCQQARP
jgi:hypothetical protein